MLEDVEGDEDHGTIDAGEFLASFLVRRKTLMDFRCVCAPRERVCAS